MGVRCGTLHSVQLQSLGGSREGALAAGMMAAATYVHSNTAGALTAAGRDFPGWPLFLTGHSMGGERPALSHLWVPVQIRNRRGHPATTPHWRHVNHADPPVQLQSALQALAGLWPLQARRRRW